MIQTSKVNGVVSGYAPTPRVPKRNDWKRTDDGVMVADVGFKKQLWTLDPELDVVWDWGSHKWEIWKFPGQAKKAKKTVDSKARHIMTVQTKGRTFRELGADILLKLQAGDTSKYSLNELVAYFDKMDDNMQRAKERDLRNKIEAITLDTFDYVRGVLKVQVPRAFRGEKFHSIKSRPTQKLARVIGGN